MTAETKPPPLGPKQRVRTPTVFQMESVECGAAALAIVLGYYGRIVPLEELRVRCGVSRDGTKASNMVRAARGYGFLAKGLKKEPHELGQLKLPFIVFWNFNHFLVVEGFQGDWVYLNDPAAGPRRVQVQEFDECFTGVVLTFEKGPEFQPGGRKRSLVAALRRRIVGSETALLYLIFTGILLAIPGLILPTFSRIFIDDYLIGGLKDWVKPLLVAMAFTGLGYGFLTWLQEYVLLRFEMKLSLSTSSAFFWHVLQLPVEFYTQRYGGEVGSRVQINDYVAKLVSGEAASTVVSLGMVVFYALLMLQYNVVLTVAGILVALLNVVALRALSRKRVDGNRHLLQDQSKLMGISLGGLQMMETLKASGIENDFFARWSGSQAKVLNGQQTLASYGRVLSSVPSLLSAINNALILGWGGLMVIQGHLTMGMLMAFQGLMGSFIMPFNRIVNLGSSLQEAEGNMNRLDDVLSYRRDPQLEVSEGQASSNEGKIKLSGKIELVDITFGYAQLDTPLIDKFSLVLKPGSRVAVVGGSGSGKSTIAKIVAGLYQPWSGELLYDDKPRGAYPRHVICNSVALVDQDIFMFEGTVRQNLTLWDDNVPEEQILQAAKDACIHDEVAARSGGYDSRVEEGGGNFSGGQRQRLEIARALVNNPSLLILDEATSALDSITEKNIDENLRRRGCSCLIVAHRLSTIRDCDEIIVLANGVVVQRGTHEEMKHEGAYGRLIAAE
jgi:NHLM bacteriocin system ABC transporter peptidase/ATP-binding protein